MLTKATNVSINAKIGKAAIYYANGDIEEPDGSIYHADGSVSYADGSFRDANGVTYYLDGSIKMPNGMIYYANGTVEYSSGLQVNANGELLNGGNVVLDEHEGNWDYDPATDNWKLKVLDENGYTIRIYYNCWVYKKNAKGTGSWYAIDEDGNMVVGWVKSKGDFFYMSPKSSTRGEMTLGEAIIGGKTYEFDKETGALIAGDIPTRHFSVIGATNYETGKDGYWKRGLDGKRYFMRYKNAEGMLKMSEPAQGWLMIDGYYYYLDNEGAPETGLKIYDGKYYYLEKNGRMLEGGEISIGNVTYVFDKATGACTKMY